MQAADVRASEWHDVVNFVRDASFARGALGFSIE